SALTRPDQAAILRSGSVVSSGGEPHASSRLSRGLARVVARAGDFPLYRAKCLTVSKIGRRVTPSREFESPLPFFVGLGAKVRPGLTPTTLNLLGRLRAPCAPVLVRFGRFQAVPSPNASIPDWGADRRKLPVNTHKTATQSQEPGPTPEDALWRPHGFRDRRIQPLCHPSRATAPRLDDPRAPRSPHRHGSERGRRPPPH